MIQEQEEEEEEEEEGEEEIKTDYIVVGPINKDIHNDTGALLERVNLAWFPAWDVGARLNESFRLVLSVYKTCIIKLLQAWSTVAASELYTHERVVLLYSSAV